ncbi:alpha/beta fold hydrolase [Streptomyces sp. NPDC006355]|uniref:alpha/beta fold hydrolase n=1 Tax=Streptomyces sp. NPDC006355 TaxID=3156758 RepID=UPI0033B9076E
MTDFVLVAGAWLGAWAWDEVAAGLRGAGHDVHALTLSGLAEKQGVAAGLETHVRDIVDEVERLGPREVALVGHSYAGIPVGLAAERIGEPAAARGVRRRERAGIRGVVPVGLAERGRAAVDRRARRVLAPARPGRLRGPGADGRADRPVRRRLDPASGCHAHRTGPSGALFGRPSGDVREVPPRRGRAVAGGGRTPQE